MSSYISYQYLNSCGYVTHEYLNSCSYATNQYVTETVNNAIEGLDIDVDLSSYVSKQYLSEQAYLTSIPSEYITEDELAQALLAYATKNYVDQKILEAEIGGGEVTIDLTYYLRKDELPSYLSGYVTGADISQMGYVTQQYLSSQSYLTQHQDLSAYATKSYVAEYVATYGGGGSMPDMSAYVTKQYLSAQSYLTQVPAGYATEAYVTNAIAGIEPVSYETTYEVTAYNTYNISIWQGTYAQYQLLPDHTTYQLYLIAAE